MILYILVEKLEKMQMKMRNNQIKQLILNIILTLRLKLLETNRNIKQEMKEKHLMQQLFLNHYGGLDHIMFAKMVFIHFSMLGLDKKLINQAFFRYSQKTYLMILKIKMVIMNLIQKKNHQVLQNQLLQKKIIQMGRMRIDKINFQIFKSIFAF